MQRTAVVTILGWRGWAVLQLLAIAMLGAWFALRWGPQPDSDWLLYWRSAGDAAAYERGGVGLWLLALAKATGASPQVAALMLNLPAALGLGALVWHVDPTHTRMLAHLAAVYLLLITPYLGIVQLDLLATAAMAGAWWCLLRVPAGPGWRQACAVLLLAVAVSTRPQFALVLWALLLLLVPVLAVLRGGARQAGVLVCAVLLAGSVLGFATDMGLRHISGRTEQIRTSSAVTLYAGLLVSADTRGERCGGWTPGAARAAAHDLHLPLLQAVRHRLSAAPPDHWWRVLVCKAP